MDARHDQAPLCPEGDFRFWTGVGAGALALLAIATVLGFGAPADLLPRLSLAAAHVTWAVLCSVAGAAGIAAVAELRRLMLTGAGARRDRGPAGRAALEQHLALERGVAAGIEDLAGVDEFDLEGHGGRLRGITAGGRT